MHLLRLPDVSHILIALILVAGLFSGLVLASCAKSFPSIYLLSLAYRKSDLPEDPSLIVRAGYFGLCARQANSSWHCEKDARSLASALGVYQDPQNLLTIQADFKDHVVFPGLMLASITLLSITFGALCTFPRWHEEVDNETGSLHDFKEFPPKHTRLLSMLTAGVSALLMLVSALWQHAASVSTAYVVENVALGGIVTHVGAPGVVLAWFSVVAVIAVFLLLCVMVWTIYVLDVLTD